MKITIEPSPEGKQWGYPTATVEVVSDDLDIYELWEELLRPALQGVGYGAESFDLVKSDD